MRRWLLAVALVLSAVALLRNVTWQKRQIARDVEAQISSPDRYVDLGVKLCTVVADPSGDELIPGAPKLRVIRTRYFGGRLDTAAKPTRIDGPAKVWREWYCSEDQEAVLLHTGRPRGQLVYGSEGAGKTTVLAMWHYLQWIRRLGENREGLQTAPTQRRLGLVKREIAKLWDARWYRYVERKDFTGFELIDGCSIRMSSTHKVSAAEGSPIQGSNNSWAARDEMQDQTEVDDDIEQRGRAAKGGGEEYDQLGTATAKDHPDWRTLRTTKLESGDWIKRALLILRSPFVSPSFVEKKKRSMSPREYQRRVLAEDVGVELAVYYAWARARNIVPRPRIATDVTAAVLTNWQPYTRKNTRFTLVCCHDPGAIFNTTEVIKLVMFGNVPTWLVVGELQTEQTTAREHARLLRLYLAETFGVERTIKDGRGRELPDPESSKAIVFCDPHGKGEAETDYDAVYAAFQHEWLDVFSPSKERIKRSARIEMINRLLGDAEGTVRLAVAQDESARPVAPKLVEAFETLEKRPGDDNPEGAKRKDVYDRTHAPAALAYGLWSFEREMFTANTVKIARAYAAKARV